MAELSLPTLRWRRQFLIDVIAEVRDLQALPDWSKNAVVRELRLELKQVTEKIKARR